MVLLTSSSTCFSRAPRSTPQRTSTLNTSQTMVATAMLSLLSLTPTTISKCQTRPLKERWTDLLSSSSAHSLERIRLPEKWTRSIPNTTCLYKMMLGESSTWSRTLLTSSQLFVDSTVETWRVSSRRAFAKVCCPSTRLGTHQTLWTSFLSASTR